MNITFTWIFVKSLLLSLFVVLQIIVQAQNAPVVAAGCVTNAVPGEQVNIPVTVSNFKNIGSASLSLNYDPTKLHFVRANINSTLGGNSSSGDQIISASLHQLVIGWYSSSGKTLPEGSTLVTFVFMYISGSPILEWYDDGPSCSFTDLLANDLNDLPTASYFKNGLVAPSCNLAAPTVGTITQPTCAVETGSVVLTGLPSDNWTINPGAITGNRSSTTISGLTAGTYNFRVTNSLGCTSANSTNIVIHSQPTDPTWTGAVNSDWNNPLNWCSGAVPASTDNLIISNSANPLTINQSSGSPVICNNLTIEQGAKLIIAADGSLTVTGTLTNLSEDGIIIQCSAIRTGSLIVNASVGSGSTVVQQYMTSGAWHMISSPVKGQTVAEFITGNTHIATRTDGISRGLMDYDPLNNKWNSFFTSGLTNGNLGSGRGFAIHTNSNDIIRFEGTLQTGDQTITGLSAGNWNCIGNPYTSSIGINNNSSAASNFLDENAANTSNLDPAYSVVYIWDQPDVSNGQAGKYTVISNTPVEESYDVQLGQGFFVKMNPNATTLNFNKRMQRHLPMLPFKSSKTVWPLIKLHAISDGKSSTTYLAFNKNMKKGLDPTYDAGLLKGGADLVVYSHLVEDNTGIPFTIQALPETEGNMIIPIGIDYKTGGEVVFSSETINMPSDYNVILEDQITKKMTDITRSIYKVVVDPNTVTTDRFRLITSKVTSDVSLPSTGMKLSAYAYKNLEIHVAGSVRKNTVASLHDILGRMILQKKLDEGNLNIIQLKNIKTGTYLLTVNDNGKLSGFKILVKE